MRPTLVLVALAVAGLAVPASASPQPTPPTDCVAVLLPTATTASCGTLGGRPQISGATNVRDLRLVVLTGSATAKLACGGYTDGVTVILDGPGTAGRYFEPGATGNCWVTITATSPATTAIASNTGGYIFK
jgi:hypothetical protein